VLVITHKLDEVLAFSDYVSVMRQGELVDTLPTAATNKTMLARLMVGKDVLLSLPHVDTPPKDEVLQVRSLTYLMPKVCRICSRFHLASALARYTALRAWRGTDNPNCSRHFGA
jgi:ABC-type uncharacterized transport system ATPase subunit